MGNTDPALDGMPAFCFRCTACGDILAFALSSMDCVNCATLTLLKIALEEEIQIDLSERRKAGLPEEFYDVIACLLTQDRAGVC